jgi:wyosine [tRNA(Phe)-imidazoG37] synthetase (radical SAM superfamily)
MLNPKYQERVQLVSQYTPISNLRKSMTSCVTKVFQKIELGFVYLNEYYRVTSASYRRSVKDVIMVYSRN